jgi:glucoamylase
MPAGKILRIETLVKAKIHWSKNNWETVIDTITEYSELGIYYADLHVSKMQKGGRILFTFYWLEAKRWENINFSVEIK